jgi:hypothetical protein
MLGTRFTRRTVLPPPTGFTCATAAGPAGCPASSSRVGSCLGLASGSTARLQSRHQFGHLSAQPPTASRRALRSCHRLGNVTRLGASAAWTRSPRTLCGHSKLRARRRQPRRFRRGASLGNRLPQFDNAALCGRNPWASKYRPVVASQVRSDSPLAVARHERHAHARPRQNRT